MKKKFIKLLILSLSCSSLEVIADSKELNNILVFHINGVNTSIQAANKNIDELNVTSNVTSNFIKWDVIYNPTHGHLMRDLLDTFKLKGQEGQDPNLDDFVKTYMKTRKLDYPEGSDEYNKLREETKKLYLKNKSFAGLNFKAILKHFHDKVPPPYKSVVKLLRKAKTNGDIPYLLLLPHSQGNQYSNQLWRYITEIEDFPKNHIRVFGIASPTNHINGGVGSVMKKPYVTATNDRVINGLRVFANLPPLSLEPLAGNVTLNCGDPWLCHGLTTDYLVDRTTKITIKNRIKENIYELYKNLIKEEKEKLNITFIFDEFLNEGSEYQLIDSAGKILCDSGSCDPNLRIYQLSRDSDEISNIFDLTHGFLPNGSYLITTKRPIPRIPSDYLNFELQLLGGYFSYFKDYYFAPYNPEPGQTACRDIANAKVEDGELYWYPVLNSNFTYFCNGIPGAHLPDESFYDNKLILVRFKIGKVP